jgi:surface-anchored protein
MSGRRSRGVRAGIAVGAVGLTAALAGCATPISDGHVDALDVDYEAGDLTLDVRDHNASPTDDDVDPATVTLNAVAASKTTVPASPAYSFLGPAGSDVWILPQTQRAGVLWPGWDTNDVPAGVLQNDRVTLRLLSASGPGSFAVYTVNSFGTPSVVLNTADGVPDSFLVNRGAHAHANWAFRAAGTYTLVFEVAGTDTAGNPVGSGPVTYTFVVEP